MCFSLQRKKLSKMETSVHKNLLPFFDDSPSLLSSFRLLEDNADRVEFVANLPSLRTLMKEQDRRDREEVTSC